MNRKFQSMLLILYPFYPIWVWLIYFTTHKYIYNYINIILLPIVGYLLISKSNKLPKYLLCLIIFTIYHISSIYYFDLVPVDSSWSTLISSDINIFACAILFIVENTEFDDRFIQKMNRNIFYIVVISLIVMLIQIKDPFFFFNIDIDKDVSYIGENRIFSIYSWIDLNTLGITFPILIAISLSVIDAKSNRFSLIALSAIVVSFLSRARYVMISTIIAFSQLLIVSTISIKRKIYFVLIILFSIVILVKAAESFGFSIQDIIEERILEKNNETEMGSALARVTSYYVFLIKFPEHPWFGVGPKTRDDVVQLLGGEAPLIHVGYLSYLYFYGIIGFLFLFLALFFLLKRAWHIGRKFYFWGSFYGLITFCFANTTFVYFNFSEMGIVLAALYLKYYSDKDEMDIIESKMIADYSSIV